MLLVALVVWVLAGPVIKPVLINLYAEYEASQKPQTLISQDENNQVDIVNIPLELPKIDLEQNNDVIGYVINIETPSKQISVNNNNKINTSSSSRKNVIVITETSKKPIDKNSLHTSLTPFSSPYNIR